LNPVRILFVSTTLAVGGAERIVQHLATRLDRGRFDVALATLRDPGGIGEELVASGFPLRQGWTGRGRLDPLLIPRLHAWFLRERFEILYFLDHPHAVFHGVLASLGTRVRMRVMPVHTMGRWGGLPSVPRSTRLLLPYLDRVIAIAEAQRDYLIREEGIPAAKITVIRNGIPIEQPDAALRAMRRAAARAELGLAPDAVVAAIVAVLRPEKNHELLLRAVARIRPRIPGMLLLLIGDGPRRDDLEEEARRLGLKETVRFLGARPEARRLWPAADLAILSSHPRVETLPLSLMEAMDAGLPVVGTDVGAMRELVAPGETGELVPAGDVEGLASAILRVLGDPRLARSYGERAQERVRERFGVERMIGETEELLLS
jgi:glycosyltransferase involved in cell wall biosynthesis